MRELIDKRICDGTSQYIKFKERVKTYDASSTMVHTE